MYHRNFGDPIEVESRSVRIVNDKVIKMIFNKERTPVLVRFFIARPGTDEDDTHSNT